MTGEEKTKKLKENLIQVITNPSCTVRDVQRLQGLANWIAQFDPIVRLLLSVTRQILRLFRNKTRDTVCQIPRNLRMRLSAWVTKESFPQALGLPSPDIKIQADASPKGWGFTIDHQRFSGKFDSTMRYSINVLELMSVWYALLIITRKNVVIQVLSDNTTTIQVLKKGFSNIPTSCPVRNDMEKSGSSELDPTSGTYKRSFQCSSRPTLQRPNFVNGVVANLQRLPTDSQAEQVSPSGLVCNSIESQTGNICQPMPGRHGNGSGCTDNQLGEVETPIPLSPVTADFPGFDETQPDYFYECSASHSRYTYETMVHGSHSTTGSFNCNGSKATTSCSEQDDDTTAHYQTSRMAVVRKAYESRFPTCHTALDLLAKPLRKSSLQDYEGKWLRFCNFLKEKNIAPKDLTLASVLEFFSYLFFEKNLRPGTVAHYRSALSVPLLLRFKIDLHDTAVTTLLKAMYIQKPNPPVTTPSWNLNKVLLLLNNLENSLSTDILLQKTAFLLLLATGWRVSELHACVRSREFCSISDDHTLRIRPHPSFLAKNECSKQRWTHKTIKPLINKDGSRGSLCPVASLKTYLQKTRKEKSHKLLLHPKSGKPLTIQQLSTYICKLIHQADPSSRRAKVHDIRKYAASCSLAETMDVSDMVTALQWSSETTFWKFYMAPTVPLSVPAVLPGTNRTDCSSMALTTLVDTHSELSAE